MTRRALSPAHEFFGSRKLRLAPQDYSPWTPPTDRLYLTPLYPRPLVARSRAPYISRRGVLAAQSTRPSRGGRSLMGIAQRAAESNEIKAVLERGPGRVVLGSKPQLATTKNSGVCPVREVVIRDE